MEIYHEIISTIILPVPLIQEGHLPASEAQLDVRPTGDQEVVGLTPADVGNILSWRFDHEIFSTVILSFPLIQEGQFLVKECAQYWLTA